MERDQALIADPVFVKVLNGVCPNVNATHYLLILSK